MGDGDWVTKVLISKFWPFIILGDTSQDTRLQSSEQQLQALLQTLAPNLSKTNNQQQDSNTLANSLKDALLKIGGGGGSITKPQSFITSEPVVNQKAAAVETFVEAFAFNEGIGNIPTNSTPNVDTEVLDNGTAPENISVIESREAPNGAPNVEADVNIDMSDNTEMNASCLMDDSTEDSLVIQEDWRL